jgi:hypothetical protein
MQFIFSTLLIDIYGSLDSCSPALVSKICYSIRNLWQLKIVYILSGCLMHAILLQLCVCLMHKHMCGKIRFLPNGLQHIGIRVSGTNLCANLNHLGHYFSQSCFEGHSTRWCILLLGVSQKVPWYSAKRMSWNIPWGLYKGKPTNTQGQSDTQTHKTNIWYKVYLCKRTFFYMWFEK